MSDSASGGLPTGDGTTFEAAESGAVDQGFGVITTDDSGAGFVVDDALGQTTQDQQFAQDPFAQDSQFDSGDNPFAVSDPSQQLATGRFSEADGQLKYTNPQTQEVIAVASVADIDRTNWWLLLIGLLVLAIFAAPAVIGLRRKLVS